PRRDAARWLVDRPARRTSWARRVATRLVGDRRVAGDRARLRHAVRAADRARARRGTELSRLGAYGAARAAPGGACARPWPPVHRQLDRRDDRTQARELALRHRWLAVRVRRQLARRARLDPGVDRADEPPRGTRSDRASRHAEDARVARRGARSSCDATCAD